MARKICLERIVALKISLGGSLLEADQSKEEEGRSNKQSVCNCVTRGHSKSRKLLVRAADAYTDTAITQSVMVVTAGITHSVGSWC